MKTFMKAVPVTAALLMACCVPVSAAPSAEEILSNAQAAVEDASGIAVDAAIDLNLGINVGEEDAMSTLTVGVNGAFGINCIKDPLQAKMDIALDVAAMGEKESVNAEMYFVEDENGYVKSYIYDSETDSWDYEISDETVESFMESITETNAISFDDSGIDFEVASDTEDIDSKSCYVLTADIDKDTIVSILEMSMEAAGEMSEVDGEEVTESIEELKEQMSVLEGLVFNLQYYIDAETYEPVKFVIDASNSDMFSINALMEESLGADAETSVSIELNEAKIEVVMDYDAVDEITVPEEAIAAETQM